MLWELKVAVVALHALFAPLQAELTKKDDPAYAAHRSEEACETFFRTFERPLLGTIILQATGGAAKLEEGYTLTFKCVPQGEDV